MEKPTRESIFRSAARQMRSNFQEIRDNVPHHGEAGGEGEKIVRDFLNEHLPGRFRAASGFIIDRNDEMSGHTDVIIYDVLNCPVYRTAERAMIIPNDNIAAVIEVKFKLTTQELDDALNKIHKVKNLTKTKLLPPFGPQNIETYGMIFAFECDLKHETVTDRWHAKLNERTPLHNSCSTIAVLDRGLFTTCAAIPGHPPATATIMAVSARAQAGTQVGIGYIETKDDTLDQMMRLLLGHLSLFRHHVDHPGFNFGKFSPIPVKWVGKFTGPGQIVYEKG